MSQIIIRNYYFPLFWRTITADSLSFDNDWQIFSHGKKNPLT